jgi:hypothetical protein
MPSKDETTLMNDLFLNGRKERKYNVSKVYVKCKYPPEWALKFCLSVQFAT